MTSLWLVMSIIALCWPPGLLAQTSLNFVKYDVIICVDSSVTIGLDNFRALLKSVLTEYIETWPIGEDAVKVGVIAFSTTLEVISMTGNLTLLEQKVPLMYYEGRSTNTHLALDQANTMFISNGRTGVPKALILLTDGRARLPDKAFESAQVLRNNSVSVWAIGVGTKYSLWELQQITANITRVNSTSTFSQLTPVDLGIPLVQVESSSTSTVIPPATTSTAMSSSTNTAATLTSTSSIFR
nr:collagen alpha-3(VI) chain-like [Biomphalaria glabrata]